MTTQSQREREQIATAIQQHHDIPQQINGRVACLIRGEQCGDYFHCVQYWTREQIEGGSKVNSDGAKLFFINTLGSLTNAQ